MVEIAQGNNNSDLNLLFYVTVILLIYCFIGTLNSYNRVLLYLLPNFRIFTFLGKSCLKNIYIGIFPSHSMSLNFLQYVVTSEPQHFVTYGSRTMCQEVVKVF